MKDEITQKDLQECILEEINELLRKERAEIVRRAHKRLKDKRKKIGT